MPFTKDNILFEDTTANEVSQEETFVSLDVPKPPELIKATEKRLRCEVLASSFKRLHCDGKASRIRDCGTKFVYAHIIVEQRWVYRFGNYCRERLCPMCVMRRTKQIFAQVSQVMNVVEKESPELTPVFLTLTLRNCKAENLEAELDIVFAGWHRLINNKRMKRLIQGWFRALEVTYNEKDDTYHPHVHVIMLMPPSYFKDPKDYMTTEKWVKAWHKALRLDYDPICYIRAVDKEDGNYSAAVGEIAKYTVKDVDYLKDDAVLTDRLVSIFGTALKGRRLYAFGGVMKETAKQLKLENADEFQSKEVTDKNGVVLRKDIDYVLVVFKWNIGLSLYEYGGRV